MSAVAVSVDQNKGFMERATRRLNLQHIDVQHDPTAASRLGSEILPALWIINANGQVELSVTGQSQLGLVRIQQTLDRLRTQDP
jgi:hypothetical protein